MSETVLSFRGVSRKYMLGQTEVYGLRSIDLDFAAGEIAAVVGPSGSGKSTLQHLGAGFDSPTSGSVVLMGRDLARCGERELARLRNASVGFVFQSYNLIPVLSALENVLYPALVYPNPDKSRAELRDRAVRLLERVGLGGQAAKRPYQFSGGQRQRIAVARALMNEPRLVFADEPTANLDHATGAGILDILEELNCEAGATLILSTHDPAVVSRARRVVSLRDGSVAEDSA